MGKPKKATAPDMRLAPNKEKYGTIDNRDKTAPKAKPPKK